MFAELRADGRPLIMGILNVTLDSFSDGGRFIAPAAACAQAERLVSEGADLIDVGGESSRPGADEVAVSLQIERVVPVIEALRARLSATIVLSVDTRSVEVAAAALSAGASVVNDISGAAAPGMLELVATRRAALVLMHMQGMPETMQIAPSYGNVVAEVHDYLFERARAAERAGIPRSHLALDPGIGFGKSREHNLRLLAGLPALAAAGYAVLLGTSRKRFMGAICRETEATELLGATCATTALGVAAGVRMFRVHDVKANRQAADVAWAIGRYSVG